MNQELVDQIKTRANVSDAAALEAAEAVVAFLKEKLPETIAPHVVGLLNGESLGDQLQDAVSDKLGGLGSLFGD